MTFVNFLFYFNRTFAYFLGDRGKKLIGHRGLTSKHLYIKAYVLSQSFFDRILAVACRSGNHMFKIVSLIQEFIYFQEVGN